jgi:nucleoside phosphorylase
MARRLRREDYTVGWVCALPVELAAAQEMLDDEDKTPQCDAHDTNIYTCGRVGEHNVVIACLPEGQTGTNSAAAVALQMKSTFASTRFGLMVGIGGGVPSEEADVRLGDVVVSKPHKVHGGVVQYDFGKATPSGFERTGFLNTPPTILLNAVANLQAKHMRGRGKLAEYISKLDSLPDFGREAAGSDSLFEASYDHERGATCSKCSKDYIVDREARRQEVMVHYGTIASGNQVMRNAAERDKVSAELGGVLCFEMEAAGLMNSFPCLVIRGVCDYADSHKNKQWQAYAAGTAAAYAKELLSVIPIAEIAETHAVEEAIREAVGLQKEIKRPSEKRATASPLDVRTNSVDQDERNGPQFGCETCDRKFRQKEAANQHATEKRHWPRFKCRTCDREFRSDKAADQHRTGMKHWPPNISCQTCPKKFYALSAAYQHLHALGHRTLIISCKMCPQKFRTETEAAQHMRDKAHLVV